MSAEIEYRSQFLGFSTPKKLHVENGYPVNLEIQVPPVHAWRKPTLLSLRIASNRLRTVIRFGQPYNPIILNAEHPLYENYFKDKLLWVVKHQT